MILLKLRSLLPVFSLLAVYSSCGSVSSYGSIRKNDLFQQDTSSYVSPFAEANEGCFKCHSLKRFEYTDEVSGQQKRGLMLPWMILGKQQFYESNHKSFICTDCHSHDFGTYPHPEELKSELHFHCLDCHGGDPAYAKFKFEEIEYEYRKSVHYGLEEKGFTCWNCHDPHSYRLVARISKSLTEIVTYDNSICLNCHSNRKTFELFSDHDMVNFKRIHKWLPRQKVHFKSVRCVECHATLGRNILVPHYIVSSDNAVRECMECHSDKPVAMSSLLRNYSNFESAEPLIDEAGLSGIKIIGPNRYRLIDNLSLKIFTALLAIIGIHILIRIIRK